VAGWVCVEELISLPNDLFAPGLEAFEGAAPRLPAINPDTEKPVAQAEGNYVI